MNWSKATTLVIRSLSLLFISTLILANPEGTLKVTLTPLKKMEGTLFICVYNRQDKFLGNPFITIQKPVTTNIEEIIIKKVPYGEYAITAYQDLNQNKVLDMLFFFPLEPWGLSNNFKPSLGPPKFDDCQFLLNSPEKKLEIEMR